MNILVQGTKDFSDYSTFVWAMGVAMSGMGEDKEFNVYSVGPVNINSHAAEFCNVTEASMRARGKKIRFFRLPVTEAEDKLDRFRWFGFFAGKEGRPSQLFYSAEATDMETAVFRF